MTPPTYDNPTDALEIFGSYVYPFDTSCATPQSVLTPNVGAFTAQSKDQWFAYHTAAPGILTLSTETTPAGGFATFDMNLSVWEGTAYASLIAPFGPGSGTFTPLPLISPYMVQAVLTTEELAAMIRSAGTIPCGPPKPRNAVAETVLVRHG